MKIFFTDRVPGEIQEEHWPIIASSSDHDGKVAVQANTEWFIEVRQHDDGRVIVHGARRAGPGGQRIGWRGATAGYLLDATHDESDIVTAIHRVAAVIGRDDLGTEAINDLPPVKL